MENNENKTHSAFISELLNPNGSHLKGNIFLKLFLQVINDDSIDLATSKVKTEHDIGPRIDKEEEGGRIDIYIWDKNNKSISIENKIYAGDQEKQLKRYYNYNFGNNKIVYLNLTGDSPSMESKGNLKQGRDFKIISYKKEIIEWLDLCIKEVVCTHFKRKHQTISNTNTKTNFNNKYGNRKRIC